MKLVLTGSAFAFVLSATLFLVSAMPAGQQTVVAQDVLTTTSEDQEEAENEEAAEDEQSSESEEAAVYNYVAQPGDSYTLMARKATQTFGITEDVSLSKAQIIFTETNLTQAAGSPLLNLDEKVEIDKGLVSEWVERAQELSEDEEAAWSTYAEGIDFNTDSVGESS